MDKKKSAGSIDDDIEGRKLHDFVAPLCLSKNLMRYTAQQAGEPRYV